MGEWLRGKRALVYGGGTGIGFACAEAMVREGAAVVVSSRRSAVLERAVERLRAHGEAGYEAGYATQVADVRRVSRSAVRFMGGLDTIVVSCLRSGRFRHWPGDCHRWRLQREMIVRRSRAPCQATT